MYASIQIPWSTEPSDREKAYKESGFVKTQGTIYLLPPEEAVLRQTYSDPPRPKTRTSSGAVALTKHFQRSDVAEDKGRQHPFWPLPKGSNERLTELADELLEKMLRDAVWRNVMMLHPGVAIYEIRNKLGYGMRWTVDIEAADEGSGLPIEQLALKNDSSKQAKLDLADRDWKYTKVTFRGFLEPIEGLNHELID